MSKCATSMRSDSEVCLYLYRLSQKRAAAERRLRASDVCRSLCAEIFCPPGHLLICSSGNYDRGCRPLTRCFGSWLHNHLHETVMIMVSSLNQVLIFFFSSVLSAIYGPYQWNVILVLLSTCPLTKEALSSSAL